MEKQRHFKCILRQKSRKQTDSNIWINFIQRQDHSLWQIFNLLSLYKEDLFLSSLHLLHLLLIKSSPLPCKSDSVIVLFFWLYKSNIRSLTLFFFPPNEWILYCDIGQGNKTLYFIFWWKRKVLSDLYVQYEDLWVLLK